MGGSLRTVARRTTGDSQKPKNVIELVDKSLFVATIAFRPYDVVDGIAGLNDLNNENIALCSHGFTV